MSYLIGIDPTQTYTAEQMQQSGKGFALGSRAVGSDGKEWVFVQADGAITGAGYICIITESYQADMAETTLSATARGDICGVAAVAFADNDYGWLQVKGPCVLRVAASCAANVRINTTATGGQLDDDGTAGSEVVQGCYLTTANGGAAATAAAMLNYPFIDATL